MSQQKRPVSIGIELPIAENKGRPDTPRWADISAMALRAEEIGLDSIWVEDHLMFRHEGQPAQGVWECWSLMAALAAVTERVEIGALVSCVSFRNPALMAKMADTVDEISNGRVILGLGAGWHEPEYDAFGFPFDHRVSRFEEALTIIHGLLKHGRMDFEGRFHSASDCELRPRGPRPEGPPILLGTTGDRMLRLTARYADAWNAYFVHTNNLASGVAPLRERVDAACHAVGRDPGTLQRTATVLVNMGGESTKPLAPHWTFDPLAGDRDVVVSELHAYAAEGISHIQIWLEPNTVESIEAFAPILETFDRG
jgi:alkanesulfonate monooxygenase SsuD/methylene tetrahydromethanopterin reductase-like flavin-dependent oxidoreductase (luciferase family)